MTSYSMMKRKPSPDSKAGTILEEVFQAALGLLAIREHSTLELQHKLARRGYQTETVAAVLARLQTDGLLNEHRYAELYAQGRADKGYGPLRLQQELRERGVSRDIIATVLADLEDHWMPKLAELQCKRFGTTAPGDLAGQARQVRFLRHRGYTSEQINDLFRSS